MPSTDKRVLITGANKGIGKATVTAVLNASDDTFVFLGSRSVERGERARADILAEHPEWVDRVEVLQIDVGDDASVAAAAETARAKFEGVRLLYGVVNNAGIGRSSGGMRAILNVNARGPHRVCEAFMPLIEEGGRIVNVSSASGPTFVAGCSDERRRTLTSPDVTWSDVERIMGECLAIEEADGDFEAAGFGGGDSYGLSKACLNAYTIELARQHPELTINACTPGFIETDMTQPYLESSGKSADEMGMKSPSQGTKVSIHLLLEEVGASGWFFGSDARRSPLDRYRSPGDPPYQGD